MDRYIAWPGQALAYKIGQLKILELRERAKKALGDKFDLRAFHDQVLDSGALPLDVLSDRIDAWIAAQKSAASEISHAPGKLAAHERFFFGVLHGVSFCKNYPTKRCDLSSYRPANRHERLGKRKSSRYGPTFSVMMPGSGSPIILQSPCFLADFGTYFAVFCAGSRLFWPRLGEGQGREAPGLPGTLLLDAPSDRIDARIAAKKPASHQMDAACRVAVGFRESIALD